jgi:hypothetical protein
MKSLNSIEVFDALSLSSLAGPNTSCDEAAKWFWHGVTRRTFYGFTVYPFRKPLNISIRGIISWQIYGELIL